MLNLSIHNNLLDLLNLTSGQILNVAWTVLVAEVKLLAYLSWTHLEAIFPESNFDIFWLKLHWIFILGINTLFCWSKTQLSVFFPLLLTFN